MGCCPAKQPTGWLAWLGEIIDFFLTVVGIVFFFFFTVSMTRFLLVGSYLSRARVILYLCSSLSISHSLGFVTRFHSLFTSPSQSLDSTARSSVGEKTIYVLRSNSTHSHLITAITNQSFVHFISRRVETQLFTTRASPHPYPCPYPQATQPCPGHHRVIPHD